MKKAVLISIILVSAFGFGHAQENTRANGFGFGMHLAQYQRDFGLGLNVTSPYFINDRTALRLRANMAWNEHLDTSNEMTWSKYSSMSIGFTNIAGQIADRIRIYGEGGIQLLFPSDLISTSNLEMGGYGLFGFEFFMSDHHNYFIELGGLGIGAKADKLATKPIYSNGFVMNVGFRLQL